MVYYRGLFDMNLSGKHPLVLGEVIRIIKIIGGLLGLLRLFKGYSRVIRGLFEGYLDVTGDSAIL